MKLLAPGPESPPSPGPGPDTQAPPPNFSHQDEVLEFMSLHPWGGPRGGGGGLGRGVKFFHLFEKDHDGQT